MLLSKLNNWLKSSFRLVLTTIVCGLLLISNAYPTLAATSKATDGEVSLDKIQSKTDSVARSNPRDINKLTKSSRKGLNAVQGDADKDKMVSPEEANGTTVKEEAANFFNNLTD